MCLLILYHAVVAIMSKYYPNGPSQYPENHEQPVPFIGGRLDTFASSNSNQWYGTEPQPSDSQPKDGGRTRLRLPASQDHVKHRRTRSGCYTCRERRVKVPSLDPMRRKTRLTARCLSATKPDRYANVSRHAWYQITC